MAAQKQKQISDLPKQIDVVVIGAGLSGVNQAYRLQTQTKRDYLMLEMRNEMGGTWSLFNYPGVRSDSDLATLGFSFNAWTGATIADGPAILQYIRDTAQKFGIDKKVHYGCKVTSADWDSATCRWTLQIEGNGEKRQLITKFIAFTTGYYDYNQALDAKLPNIDRFQGKIVHPQFWPKDLDYANKKVVVIGSGATAVTLLPSMVDKVKHITMLQRSPSYYVALARNSKFTQFWQAILPASLCHRFLRFVYALQAYWFFYTCQYFPRLSRKILRLMVKHELPKNFPLDPHFDPNYNPWDQRVCFVPDGDLFKSLGTGKAAIVTDHIDTFTENGIKTKSGKTLEADIVVTATGLKIQLLGGAGVTVDGVPAKLGKKMIYKGTFLQGVPNAGLLIGYVNASWTLGSDVSAQHVTKLLNYLEKKGYDAATPTVKDTDHVSTRPLISLKSNYLARAEDEFPKSGDKQPWFNKAVWFNDFWVLWTETFGNSVKFTKATKQVSV